VGVQGEAMDVVNRHIRNSVRAPDKVNITRARVLYGRKFGPAQSGRLRALCMHDQIKYAFLQRIYHVVVVVVNGSYSAAPNSSPDRECITKSQLIKIKHRRST